ncbi:MAG: hypothetical protein JWR69_1717 [Pedosphaera sp.]|nr:hypothetical protein [Pedosphaera sp.]
MNTAVGVPPVIRAARSASEGLRAVAAAFWKCAVFVWKFVVGMILCQSLVGGVLIVGWTYRLMQRTAYKRWWQRSELHVQGRSFREFIADEPVTQAHRHWPNWLVEQNALEAVRKQPFKALVHSLCLNLRIGAQGIFNTWMLTMPGCVLMWFSWYDGWNNSFSKGYEQAVVGPLTGILGLLIFIVAMLYVPMAQARQAATGEWRSFYQFRLVRRLVLRRWPACLGLGVLYSLFSVPILALQIMPQFFPQMNKQSAELLAAMTEKQIADGLDGYFFVAAAVVFPAYVVLRLVAARIYATGLLAAVEEGAVAIEALAERERAALGRLNLLQVRSAPGRHVLIRLVGTTVNWVFWGTATVVMLLVWFSFAAQIYIGQFMNYIPGLGWLNQPLVQLPWFHHLPHAMK